MIFKKLVKLRKQRVSKGLMSHYSVHATPSKVETRLACLTVLVIFLEFYYVFKKLCTLSGISLLSTVIKYCRIESETFSFNKALNISTIF